MIHFALPSIKRENLLQPVTWFINIQRQSSQLLLLAVFIIINVILMIAARPEAALVAGADANRYMDIAMGLLQYGTLVDTHAPEIPYVFGPPLYQLLLAIPLSIFSFKAALVVIEIIQLILLYVTGLMTRTMIAPFLPRVATLAQVFIIFNPNSLSTAHLIQSETLFTFFLTAALCSIFAFGRQPGWKWSILTGLFAGLATLVRPVTLYAIPLLPIVLGVFGVGKKETGLLRKTLLAGCLSTIVAGITIAPWFIRNYSKFERIFFTTEAGTYVYDNYQLLMETGNGLSQKDVVQLQEQLLRKHLEGLGIENFSELPDPERSRILFKIFANEIFKQPISVHSKALLHSWLSLYVAGGASNFKSYLGWSGKSLHQIRVAEKWRGYKHALYHLFSQRESIYYLFLVVITMGIAIVLRVLGLLGLVSLFRDGRWPYGLIFVEVLLFFTASCLYVGNSRFRVPLEPIIAVLAALGYEVFRKFLNRRRLRAT